MQSSWNDSPGDNYLFKVDFDIRPNIAMDFKERERFDKEINKYTWLVNENGVLVGAAGVDHKHIPEVNFVFDAEDETTVWSLNQISRLFDKKFKKSEELRWRCKIYQEFCTNGDYWKDTITIVDVSGKRKFALLDIGSRMSIVRRQERELIRELEQVEKELQE